MSLVGNLKDLGLAEILQIVSLSRKSGVLGIRSGDHEANIVFRQGQVVKATATTCPVELAGMLLAKGLVDQTTLEFAKSLQQDGGFSRRLGDILIQECKVDASLLDELIHGLVENTVYSLFGWEEGTFDFDLQDNLDLVDDIRTDPLQLMLEKGLSPQYLAMEGSRLIDEQRHASSMSGGENVEPAQSENVDFEFDLLNESVSCGFEEDAETEQQVNNPSEAHLFLVDDDELTRNLLSAFLLKNSYSVACFARGEDALIALDSIHRDGANPLLLVDLVMPRMDGTGLLGGLELLELIHSNFPGSKVLALTDRRDVEAERKIADMRYPLILKPSPKEMTTDSIVTSFTEKLMLHLTGLRSREVKVVTDTINIGDDLRREMGEESAVSNASTSQSTGISLLRGMLEELNDPALGGGIILLVLRFASEFMARAVIFTVKGNEIVGLGQFGINDLEQPGDVRVRAMRVPLSEKTIFSEVVESQLPVKLQMDDSRWCKYMQEHLGGNTSEAFLGPIVSEGRVVAILYGDNGYDSRPIGDTDSLEIFLSQAGIAMEKALLQRRLKEKNLEGM
jgi:CheY-like chemotaxis protein